MKYNNECVDFIEEGEFKISNFDFTWFIAIISITGSFFNIKKNVICFYFWCICELFCCIIDIKNNQYGRAFLDAFCFCMNIYGIFVWTKGKISKNSVSKVEKDPCDDISSLVEDV